MASITLLDDALELAELLTPTWGQISDSVPAWHPRCEGADGSGDGSGDGDGTGDGDGDGDGASDGAGDGAGDDVAKLRDELRKHRGTERRAKQAEKERDALRGRIQELEATGQTEQEKAIAKAREEAKAEADAANTQERRNDRLEVAVARQAAKAFADVDDALLHIQRGINSGDIDADDIFDDKGKVQTEALKSALDDLLERKPHLKADHVGRPGGSSDAGRGSSGRSLEDMDVEAHLGAIKRHK